MIEKNDILTLKVVDYDMEGFGICKNEQFVIFVPNALIGEIVEIVIVKVNKNFAFGKILKIIEKHPNRRMQLCETYAMCGGCNLMHAKYTEQLRIKKNL